VEDADQITHEVALDDDLERHEELDVFRPDPEFEKNESMWRRIRAEIFGQDVESDGSTSSEDSSEESSDESESSEEEEAGNEEPAQSSNAATSSSSSASSARSRSDQEQTVVVTDLSDRELITLRKKIYLTIQSSMDFEEGAHKLFQLKLQPGLEREVVNMIIECCAQERTFQRYFGLLAQRFCLISQEY